MSHRVSVRSPPLCYTAPMDTQTDLTDLTDIPDWLRIHGQELAYAIEHNLDSPDPRFPRTKLERELREHNLECLFEQILDVISEDLPIIDANGFKQSGFTQGEIMRWVFANKERKQRYREAQKIGMEIRQQLLGKIAQGNEMSDVQRDKLEIDTHKWRMERLYKEQYAASTNVDITTVQVDLRQLLDDRASRIKEVSQSPLGLSTPSTSPYPHGETYDAD